MTLDEHMQRYLSDLLGPYAGQKGHSHIKRTHACRATAQLRWAWWQGTRMPFLDCNLEYVTPEDFVRLVANPVKQACQKRSSFVCVRFLRPNGKIVHTLFLFDRNGRQWFIDPTQKLKLDVGYKEQSKKSKSAPSGEPKTVRAPEDIKNIIDEVQNEWGEHAWRRIERMERNDQDGTMGAFGDRYKNKMASEFFSNAHLFGEAVSLVRTVVTQETPLRTLLGEADSLDVCLLLAALCLRFNCFDPDPVLLALSNAVRASPDVTDWRRRLAAWRAGFATATTRADVLHHLAVLTPPDVTDIRRCGVVLSTVRNTTCQTAACPGWRLCSEHVTKLLEGCNCQNSVPEGEPAAPLAIGAPQVLHNLRHHGYDVPIGAVAYASATDAPKVLLQQLERFGRESSNLLTVLRIDVSAPEDLNKLRQMLRDIPWVQHIRTILQLYYDGNTPLTDEDILHTLHLVPRNTLMHFVVVLTQRDRCGTRGEPTYRTVFCLASRTQLSANHAEHKAFLLSMVMPGSILLFVVKLLEEFELKFLHDTNASSAGLRLVVDMESMVTTGDNESDSEDVWTQLRTLVAQTEELRRGSQYLSSEVQTLRKGMEIEMRPVIAAKMKREMLSQTLHLSGHPEKIRKLKDTLESIDV